MLNSEKKEFLEFAKDLARNLEKKNNWFYWN